MRILIIRHGDPNYANDCLTEKGKREAELLAKRLQREKVDFFYTSPLGRAKETCMVSATAQGKEQEVVTLDWLREFCHRLVLPSGRERDIAWDMLPDEWIETDAMYDYKRWKEQDFYRQAGLDVAYDKVAAELDGLLAKHGYVRDGNCYRVERANTDTVALFCHFGLESVLLSRLCNLSPVSLWHNFVALTSSVTTLYSEERRKGKAVFRCQGFSDVSHLYAGNETPSFSARFCEIFDSKDRHD